ncbi:cysteine--tRNA ligase [Candidatus Saccharibacteria bacterium]|nr:cysteine--tRNA ligase [Candidatus Saccharibacteria bacterium]
MKLHNTLTRQIDEIIPITPGKLGVYTCGPTVYDYAHIGHWFNYVRMDTLVRALRYEGNEVTWVMNITDVGHLVSDSDDGEDKLEKGAKREGKTAWQVAEFYTADFIACMKLLAITKPDHITKATDHITEQIALVELLEAKGYTYVISDGVYYDTSKFEGYASFARLDLEEQQAGARVSFNPEKRNGSDFAVWKFSPDGATRDMEWDSPWGRGFPGWHIECSAMSMKYLGDTLDIHTGGIDHVPIHHTNEIAQSEAATGKRFANYWMHSNHVMVEGEKISKSLGNGVRLQEIIERGITPAAVRLHVLESQYHGQSKFSWDGLVAAQNRLRDLQAMAVLRYQARPITHDTATFALRDVPIELMRAVAEDLNTPAALAFLSGVSTQLQSVLIEDDMVDHFEAMLAGIDALLGLGLGETPDITASQKELLIQRTNARSAKDWAASDHIRDQLTAHDIGVRDTSDGPIWFRLV